ncbi:hypothetical protein VP01_418g1 [Puccinia sorghi]|uniref:Uncharacterized protein n=1 Tax=Puccinia sorghi TaxID=27349 RepID=A0A0L6UQU1_9BASI|nr:hypothetical protein VP01_418g1 [Puccinia sorghi]
MHSHCAYCTVTVPKHPHMQTGGVWMTAWLEHAACQLQAVEQVFYCSHNPVPDILWFPRTTSYFQNSCLSFQVSHLPIFHSSSYTYYGVLAFSILDHQTSEPSQISFPNNSDNKSFKILPVIFTAGIFLQLEMVQNWKIIINMWTGELGDHMAKKEKEFIWLGKLTNIPNCVHRWVIQPGSHDIWPSCILPSEHEVVAHTKDRGNKGRKKIKGRQKSNHIYTNTPITGRKPRGWPFSLQLFGYCCDGLFKVAIYFSTMNIEEGFTANVTIRIMGANLVPLRTSAICRDTITCLPNIIRCTPTFKVGMATKSISPMTGLGAINRDVGGSEQRVVADTLGVAGEASSFHRELIELRHKLAGAQMSKAHTKRKAN